MDYQIPAVTLNGGGNPDPNTYFKPPVSEEQTQANRLFQRCMSAHGWWNQQPRL